MENKCFTITLDLTHFFQDHRSMCVILINKRMKCIQDLKEHVEQILDLQNFYFSLNRCYIPLPEDIRVLQPGDVVVAMPNHDGSASIFTSTQLLENKNDLSIEGKRKRKSVAADNNMVMPLPNFTKKKKQKRLPLTVETIENEIPKLNKEKVKSRKRCYDENEDPIEDVAAIAERPDSTSKLKKKSKKLKKQYVSPPIDEEPADTINNSYTSVKEKVLYFEEHTNASKLRNNVNDNEFKVDTTVDEHIVYKGNDHETDLVPTKNTVEEKENNLEYLRQKKLFIQKRNNDIISYELPKKSNIVKSILVLNQQSEDVHSNVNLPVKQNNKTSYVSEDIDHSLQELVQEEYKMFVSAIQNNLSDRNKSTSNLEHPKQKLKNHPMQPVILQDNEINTGKTDAETLVEEPVTNSNRKIASPEKETVVAAIEDITDKENIAINKDTNNSHEENEVLEEILRNKILRGNFSNNIREHLDSSSVCNRNDTGISSEHDPITIVSHSETDLSVLNDIESNATTSNTVLCAETTSFVTKRKRKRSHKKRKSRTSSEISFVPVKPAKCYPKPSPIFTSPAIHIKFGDDDEDQGTTSTHRKAVEAMLSNCRENVNNTINITPAINQTDNTEKIDEKTFEKSGNDANQRYNDSANDPRKIEQHKWEKSRLSEKIINLVMDSSESAASICDETTNEISKLFNSAKPLISEDTILKSPLMTATKPKCGDIIAFKILRLTADYTPQISKYVIGEVQSVDQDNSNIDINIIDGFDECREPDGKFSLEPFDEDVCSIKCFSWSDLIESRLIFP